VTSLQKLEDRAMMETLPPLSDTLTVSETRKTIGTGSVHSGTIASADINCGISHSKLKATQ
jgi:hypothetical protein